MKRITGALWGVLICLLITLFFGCKTKKTIVAESVKRTYDSAQVVKERVNTHYSIIDTTAIDEVTNVIREYIFDTPAYCVADSLVHDAGKEPMVEIKADGSVVIYQGLKSIKETKISRKNEKKGITERKDSTSNKDTNTKVATSENTKKTNKQIDKVQIAQPFCWWQQIGVLIIIGVILYCLWRYRPTIRNITKHILNKIKRI